MLSKKIKNAIIFGFLGGVVGFVIAIVFFVLSCSVNLGLGGAWRPPIYPMRIIVVGTITACSILALSLILRIKLAGRLIALVIFLMAYIVAMKISQSPELPIYFNSAPVFCISGIVSALILLMFIYAGVKQGMSLSDRDNKRE